MVAGGELVRERADAKNEGPLLKQVGGALILFLQIEQYHVAKPLRITLASPGNLNNFPRYDCVRRSSRSTNWRGPARGLGRSMLACFGSAGHRGCSVLLRSDVAVDYCVVEIGTRDGFKKSGRKIGLGHTLFVRLFLKTERNALGKRNHQSFCTIAFRRRRSRAPTSKTNSALGAFHARGSQLTSVFIEADQV